MRAVTVPDLPARDPELPVPQRSAGRKAPDELRQAFANELEVAEAVLANAPLDSAPDDEAM